MEAMDVTLMPVSVMILLQFFPKINPWCSLLQEGSLILLLGITILELTSPVTETRKAIIMATPIFNYCTPLVHQETTQLIIYKV